MESTRVENLGFVCIAQMSVERFLPPGRSLRPTLCFSDTHLLPGAKSYSADVPAALAELLELMPEFQIFILGDFTESLLLTPAEIRRLGRARRLNAVMDALRYRPGLRIVPGNHDRNALRFLHHYFGPQRIFIGGFRLGRLAFVHGHENALDAAGLADRLPMVVSLGGDLNRLGVHVPYGTATNSAIAAPYQAAGLYPIFGHTHISGIWESHANSGCFLDDYRSFLTIAGQQLNLWEGRF